MRATIREKREVARGTLLVTFDLGGDTVDFEPGQYFWVELLDPPYTDEKGNRRHITVVTSPTERGVLGLATRIRDTGFKRSLAELPVGAPVEVEQPKGSFVLPADAADPLAFVAGGIGITPFHSMLHYVADRELPHRITLFYSNRDRESAAFLDEVREWERTIGDFRAVVTMTGDPSWEGETRRLGVDLFREELGDLAPHRFMVAGPPAFADAMVAQLKDAGVEEDRVARDGFAGY